MNKSLRILLIGLGCMLIGCSRVEEKKQPDFLVINVLEPEYYQDAHIKGSVNVPFVEVERYVQSLDKNVPIVMYCANYACSASGAAAAQLVDRGFKQVWAYEGGTAEWLQLQLPVEGPATKDYLRASNVKPEQEEADHQNYTIITADELKRKMEQHKLL